MGHPLLRRCIPKIIHAVRTVLERTPPELDGDLAKGGIVPAGGGGY